jgi:hypothetical protein
VTQAPAGASATVLEPQIAANRIKLLLAERDARGGA